MKTKRITQLGALLAIALAIQSLHLPTFITGPVINAVLIVAVVYPGLPGSIIIGCITPLMALTMGIVHPIAAPLVPVIMAANATLGITFYLLRKRNDYLALVGAAAAKFFVFYLFINYLIGILGIKLPAPVLAAFQLPQLFTAIVGGFAALGVIKQLERIYKTSEEDVHKSPEEDLPDTLN